MISHFISYRLIWFLFSLTQTLPSFFFLLFPLLPLLFFTCVTAVLLFHWTFHFITRSLTYSPFVYFSFAFSVMRPLLWNISMRIEREKKSFTFSFPCAPDIMRLNLASNSRVRKITAKREPIRQLPKWNKSRFCNNSTASFLNRSAVTQKMRFTKRTVLLPQLNVSVYDSIFGAVWHAGTSQINNDETVTISAKIRRLIRRADGTTALPDFGI